MVRILRVAMLHGSSWGITSYTGELRQHPADFSYLIHGNVLSKLRLMFTVPSIFLYSIPILNHSVDFTHWLMPLLEVIDVEYLLASFFIWHPILII